MIINLFKWPVEVIARSREIRLGVESDESQNGRFRAI